MSKKILVTLDFDQTVSPINQYYDFNADPDFNVYRFGWNCAVRKNVVEFLQHLSTLDTVETVWASSWVESTGSFHTKSGGDIPVWDWLQVSFDVTKAESIYAHAVQGGFSQVHVFEDSPVVAKQLQRMVEKNNAKIEVLSYLCKTKVGITDEMISKFKTIVN